MSRRDLPQGVDVVDFGIRGLDLSYALLDDGYRGGDPRGYYRRAMLRARCT